MPSRITKILSIFAIVGALGVPAVAGPTVAPIVVVPPKDNCQRCPCKCKDKKVTPVREVTGK